MIWPFSRSEAEPPALDSAAEDTMRADALAHLAAAQDGGIGAGLPLAYDQRRRRWGPLSPAASAEVAAALIDQALYGPDADWQARTRRLLRWLVGVQRADGMIQATTLSEPARRASPAATAMAVSAWSEWVFHHDEAMIGRAADRGAAVLSAYLANRAERRATWSRDIEIVAALLARPGSSIARPDQAVCEYVLSQAMDIEAARNEDEPIDASILIAALRCAVSLQNASWIALIGELAATRYDDETELSNESIAGRSRCRDAIVRYRLAVLLARFDPGAGGVWRTRAERAARETYRFWSIERKQGPDSVQTSDAADLLVFVDTRRRQRTMTTPGPARSENTSGYDGTRGP